MAYRDRPPQRGRSGHARRVLFHWHPRHYRQWLKPSFFT